VGADGVPFRDYADDAYKPHIRDDTCVPEAHLSADFIALSTKDAAEALGETIRAPEHWKTRYHETEEVVAQLRLEAVHQDTELIMTSLHNKSMKAALRQVNEQIQALGTHSADKLRALGLVSLEDVAPPQETRLGVLRSRVIIASLQSVFWLYLLKLVVLRYRYMRDEK
jgi:hypothetical protein